MAQSALIKTESVPRLNNRQKRQESTGKVEAVLKVNKARQPEPISEVEPDLEEDFAMRESESNFKSLLQTG